MTLSWLRSNVCVVWLRVTTALDRRVTTHDTAIYRRCTTQPTITASRTTTQPFTNHDAAARHSHQSPRCEPHYTATLQQHTNPHQRSHQHVINTSTAATQSSTHQLTHQHNAINKRHFNTPTHQLPYIVPTHQRCHRTNTDTSKHQHVNTSTYLITDSDRQRQ
jgi:uncharacterized protein YcgI (DUF1989 family)